MTSFYEFITQLQCQNNNDRMEKYRSISPKNIEKFYMLSNIVICPKEKLQSDIVSFISRIPESSNKKHSIKLNKKNHKILLICTKKHLIKFSSLF